MEGVHSDLKRLEVVGILILKEGGPSDAIQPIVPFDQIEVHIDYRLLDPTDADDGRCRGCHTISPVSTGTRVNPSV